MEIIWLSHVLSSSVPHYGGSQDLRIMKNQSQENGDSCNTVSIEISSHSGTHIDAPYHFLPQGKTIDSYSPSSWIFKNPRLVDIKAKPGELINSIHFQNVLHANDDTDFLLVRTGFEKYRTKNMYWENAPGFAPELAAFFLNLFPNLKAFGIDCISISSLKHRPTGRLAHKSFLSNDLLIVEDMRLSSIDENEYLKQLIILPMRIQNGDGAPCTAIGFVEKKGDYNVEI